MSVLIKGAKMPDYCEDCSLYDWVDPVCRVSGVDIDDENLRGCRPGWCPLVEVPEKHGRLIDGDVLWDAMSKYNDNEGAKMPFGYDDTSIHIDSSCFVIENAPTVIEAEGE